MKFEVAVGAVGYEAQVEAVFKRTGDTTECSVLVLYPPSAPIPPGRAVACARRNPIDPPDKGVGQLVALTRCLGELTGYLTKSSRERVYRAHRDMLRKYNVKTRLTKVKEKSAVQSEQLVTRGEVAERVSRLTQLLEERR